MAHLQSPANFAASNNLALALVEQDKEKTAEAKKRKALEYAADNVQKNNKVSEAWSTYGWVLYKNGKVDEAEKALTNALSGGQLSADTAYYFARVLSDKGRAEQAERFAQAAVDSNRPFTKRREAKLLLEELKSKAPEKPSKKSGDKTSGK
jgi:tetratricopeptide (TPR) repeat protein